MFLMLFCGMAAAALHAPTASVYVVVDARAMRVAKIVARQITQRCNATVSVTVAADQQAVPFTLTLALDTAVGPEGFTIVDANSSVCITGGDTRGLTCRQVPPIVTVRWCPNCTPHTRYRSRH